MEIIKVGLLLKDKEFANKLAEGLSREYRRLEFYLLDSLVDDNMDLIISDIQSDNPKVILAVTSFDEVDDNEIPPYRVCIYKDCRNLINDLLFIYFKLTGKVCEYRGERICKTLIFAADQGGIGVTSTAIAVGTMLYRIYESKCLYINLCPFDDSVRYLNHEKGSLLKLQYYLEKTSEFPISSFITENEELDCINTGVINSYFNEMKPEIMSKLMAGIDNLGRYSYLIIDIGNHMSKENRSLITQSDLMIFNTGYTGNTHEYREYIYREILRLREEKPIIRLERDYGYEIADISKKIVEILENDFSR